MDKRTQPQWMVSGLVEAPVEQVWPLILELSDLTQMMQEVRPQNGLIVTDKPHVGRIEIDPHNHSILMQGHWWYHGIQRVLPHARGSLIRYEVYNIAPGVGWWAAQLVQGPQHAREMKGILQNTLSMLSQRLNCRTELINI
jgi:hypothetical protein